MGVRLHRIGRSTIPLPEVSGLCSLPGVAGTVLVALGDARASIARSDVTAEGAVGPWTVVSADELGAPPDSLDRFGQLESVALDGVGCAWVLTEGTSVLAGIDLARRTPVAVATLDTASIPDLHATWAPPEASRGEGLLLLRNGHVVVAKEKEPAGLVEFGPVGEAALGISTATLLAPAEAFAAPPEVLHALAWWPWDRGDVLEDLSDFGIDENGGVWLLSDQSRVLAPLVLPVQPGDPPRIGEVLELPKRIDKPEGLAFLGNGIIAVADDRHDDEENLWLLRLPG